VLGRTPISDTVVDVITEEQLPEHGSLHHGPSANGGGNMEQARAGRSLPIALRPRRRSAGVRYLKEQ
jgi:hypothetical protein